MTLKPKVLKGFGDDDVKTLGRTHLAHQSLEGVELVITESLRPRQDTGCAECLSVSVDAIDA